MGFCTDWGCGLLESHQHLEWPCAFSNLLPTLCLYWPMWNGSFLSLVSNCPVNSLSTLPVNEKLTATLSYWDSWHCHVGGLWEWSLEFNERLYLWSTHQLCTAHISWCGTGVSFSLQQSQVYCHQIAIFIAESFWVKHKTDSKGESSVCGSLTLVWNPSLSYSHQRLVRKS